jgi:hypothetical protein
MPVDQPFVGGPFGAGPQAGPAIGPFPGNAAPTTPTSDPAAGMPVIKTEPEPQNAPAAAASSEPAGAAPAPTSPPEEKKEPRIVRIPCPQGHELQTPMDMLNQEVLCPICNTQFHLRYEDSIDFKEEQAELRRRKAEQLNQAALKWSIIAAVVIVLAIITMIIYLAVRAPSENNYVPPEPPVGEAPADTAGDVKNDEQPE